MPLPYTPPGVSIIEVAQPNVVPLVTSTAEVVIVGPSAGSITRVDVFEIKNPKEKEEKFKLPYLEALPAGAKLQKILSVKNSQEPGEPEGSENKGFKEEAKGYKEVKAENAIGIPAESEIPDKAHLAVEYTYTPADYWNPIRLFSAADVQQRFGNPLTGNLPVEGLTVASPLSLAAQFAFENGANSLILQPLFKTPSGELEMSTEGFIENAEAPLEKEIGEKTTWGTTLKALALVGAIDLIVPAVGLGIVKEGKISESEVEAIIALFLNFEALRAQENQYVVGVFGADGSTGGEGKPATELSRKIAGKCRSFAELAQQNIVVNTTNFGYQLSEKPVTIPIGGQYAAAAVAGALASRPAAVSLTRKGLNGFTTVLDNRLTPEKNKDAEEGLLVVEQIRSGQIRVRHAITTDTNSGAARSEVSVVRAKFNMVESIKETLENQIIGKIIADANSPVIVRSAISAVLSALQQAGQLVGFSAPVCQLTSFEPTKMLASFTYRPAFTLNYIEIKFALDLTSQSVTIVEKTGTSG